MCNQFVMRGGSVATPASAHAPHLPQLLPARCPVAVHGPPTGEALSAGVPAGVDGHSRFSRRRGFGIVTGRAVDPNGPTSPGHGFEPDPHALEQNAPRPQLAGPFDFDEYAPAPGGADRSRAGGGRLPLGSAGWTLATGRKTLPCKFFYDDRGSHLFDRICDLPEYYPTRTELAITRRSRRRHGPGRRPRRRCWSSTAAAVEHQDPAAARRPAVSPAGYVPIDISRGHLIVRRPVAWPATTPGLAGDARSVPTTPARSPCPSTPAQPTTWWPTSRGPRSATSSPTRSRRLPRQHPPGSCGPGSRRC